MSLAYYNPEAYKINILLRLPSINSLGMPYGLVVVAMITIKSCMQLFHSCLHTIKNQF